MSSEFKITDELVKQFLYRTGSVGGDITRLYEEWDKFKESKQRAPLFITEDGVKIFDHEEVFYTCVVGQSWGCSKTNARKELIPVPSYFKYFSTEELCKEYILMNKPLLSLNEIKKIGQIGEENIYFERLIQAAKVKLNQ
jgi:hypothetical protein